MKACIRRGNHQVGGTCIELESRGLRIVLDVGLPLDADPSLISYPRFLVVLSPYPVDHSVYDAYALVVEADVNAGRNLNTIRRSKPEH